MADRQKTWWALCAGTVLLAGWGVWRVASAIGAEDGPPPLPARVVSAPSPTAASSQSGGAPASANRPAQYLSRSAPTKILVPSIRLRAWVDQVGLAADGTVETPPYDKANRASWFREGPSPGEAGPAVILGHVDSKKSVAVFFYLTRIKPGDRIEILRADGKLVPFTVSSVEQFPKDAFPTQRVYGDTPGPTLRLVTCGGKFDKKKQAYQDNIVVFANAA